MRTNSAGWFALRLRPRGGRAVADRAKERAVCSKGKKGFTSQHRCIARGNHETRGVLETVVH